MTEDEKLNLSLSEKLLKLVMDEKISFEKKKGKIDYLIRLGADVNADLGCNSMLVYAQELGDEELVKYLKEKGGVEFRISKEKRDELGKQFWDESGAIKSVEEIKELVLKGANLGAECVDGKDYAGNVTYKQIWKDLSVSDMNKILKDLPKGYVIDGDVDLANRELTELPDFSKTKVNGYFYCDENELKDLIGAPEKVSGDFACSRNRLKSLKGAPKEIGCDFVCGINFLTTLEGSPSKVRGDFHCGVNLLNTLQGAPKEVGGDFSCNHNRLTTLEGAPTSVGGFFECSYAQLKSLKGAPSKVGGIFDCSYNQLTDLRGAPEKVGGYFNCKGNQLTSLEGKPKKIGLEFLIEDEVLENIKREKRSKSILERMFAKREV